LYRGINDFKKGYQPRTNIGKDEKGDLVANTHSNLVRFRKHLSKILNVHGVSDGRQTEIHTAEPLVPEPSAFGNEIAVEKLKSHKSPGIGELIKAGVRTICYEIHKLINCIWNKQQSPMEWEEYLFI